MRTRPYSLTAVRTLATLLLALVVLSATLGVAAAGPGTVTADTTAAGELEDDDEQMERTSGRSTYYDEYTVRGTGGTATIDMNANSPSCFSNDPYLFLYDSNGNEIERDDDGGDVHCDSRITRTLSNSDYTVRAGSYGHLDTFGYTLTLDGARFGDADRRYAEFEILAVNVSDETPTVGEEFTVTAVVGNVGNMEGRYTATLYADGTRAGDRHSVRLDAGETTTLTFTGTMTKATETRLFLQHDYVGTIEIVR